MEKLKAVECVGYTHIETEGGRGVAYDMLAKDARRVVACVNALQGVPTELLESAAQMGITDVSRGNMFSSRMKLQRQRDQLLEALVVSEHFMVVACDWNMEVVEINGEMRTTGDLLRIVRTAIAAVKGDS